MDIKKKLAGKNILITGGTGSFGHQIVSQLLKFQPNKIIVFSRDEKKQYDMQNEFEEYSDILDFIIGDVRDYLSIYEATKNIDIMYHTLCITTLDAMEVKK